MGLVGVVLGALACSSGPAAEPDGLGSGPTIITDDGRADMAGPGLALFDDAGSAVPMATPDGGAPPSDLPTGGLPPTAAGGACDGPMAPYGSAPCTSVFTTCLQACGVAPECADLCLAQEARGAECGECIQHETIRCVAQSCGPQVAAARCCIEQRCAGLSDNALLVCENEKCLNEITAVDQCAGSSASTCFGFVNGAPRDSCFNG